MLKLVSALVLQTSLCGFDSRREYQSFPHAGIAQLVESWSSKPAVRVRFPLPAPKILSRSSEQSTTDEVGVEE